MPVEPTSYDVPGWGSGELWLRGAVVLAHEFLYARPSAGPRAGRHADVSARPQADLRAGPPMGAHGPPIGTLAGNPSREANGSVSSLHRSVHTSGARSAGGLVERFRAFLAGEPVPFDDIELDLGWATPFQLELTRALRAIPRGEVVTYGELAALAGRPGAARAAGTFCATNRFAFIVPCHRVVAAGGIGGYGPDGVSVKRRLLALEGVEA